MATFTKSILSGSTDGRAIKVAATSSPGTTVHTGSSTAADIHEVWLYAQNTGGSDAKLTVEWGGSASPDDLIELTITTEAGLTLIAPGLLLKGNATPLVVKAFAATTNVITLHGFVNEIV
jgi:hypothetical protein